MKPLHTVLPNTKGAVLVAGLAMAVLLTGVLWHLASIGDAIVYRERMQEAADTTAFESAVFHARTMNLLVVLNIVMSAVLSVLVMWRILEFILGIVIVIAAALSWIPGLWWLGAIAATLTNVLMNMINIDRVISKAVQTALGALNKAERAVSSIAPIVNHTVPIAGNSAYWRADPSVKLAFPVSLSIVPGIEKGLAKVDFPQRMNLTKLGPSMPIQEDYYSKVCGKAAEFVPKQIASLLKRLGAEDAAKVFEKIGHGLETAAGEVPVLFCEGIGGSHKLDELVKSAAQKKCDQLKKEFDEKKKKGGKK